jgi:hypothetical protein
VSIWVALERSSLYLDGNRHTFNAGDVVVFSGDFPHGGAEADSTTTEPNYRLFAYVPTRRIPVPWQVKPGMGPAAVAAEVKGDQENQELHKTTNPVSDDFDPKAFQAHLYDFTKNKFYRFSTELWLGGLTTNTSEVRKYKPYAQGKPDLGADPVIGKCPHFEPRDFNASKHEKGVLCNFRRQCVYCQGLKNKRARCAE